MTDTRIVLEQYMLDAMFSHARSTFPEECCGLMFGSFQEGISLKKVASSKRMENVFESKERFHRYTIDPKEFMAAEIEAQKRGEEVVGIYHSHPNAPAKPSLFDQNHAWPTLSYIVIEVREAKPVKAASWILKDDRSEFLQEELTVSKK
ncbi:MAG: M67 family metallopeptidase [Nitrososphaerales archaeon]